MHAGLLITDKSIKAVKIAGKKPMLANVSIEAGVLENGLVKDREKFKSALLRLSSQLALNKGEVILGLPEKHIFSKTVTIKDHEIDFDEKIREELEMYVPEGGQSYTDWQVSERSADFETIFVSSAPASILDTYLEILEEASIMIVGIEPLAVALSRHIPKVMPSIGTPVVQPTTVNKPLAHRAFSEPGGSLNRRSGSGEPQGKQANPPAKGTAEVEKTQPTSTLLIALEESDVLLTIISEKGRIELTSVLPQGNANELSSEISNMRSFYDKKTVPDDKHGGHSAIGRVFLTGEGATEELKNQIATHLAITSDLLRIPDLSIPLQNALSFFPVFALTDLSIVYPKNHEHINLLPDDRLSMQEQVRALSARARFIGIATSFFGILCLLYVAILAFLFFDAMQSDNELLQLRERTQTSDTLGTRKKVHQINKHISIIEKFRKDTSSPLAVLSFLSERAPSGVVITHYVIDLTSNAVLVNGQSLERERLLAFREILEGEQQFQNVRIPLASLEKRGVSAFSLSFEVKK